VKSSIAISLLLLHLCATTEIHELLKAPVLIRHFIEHRSENQDLSFWGFISLHYAQGKAKPADYDKDMELPFKSIPEITCVVSMVALIPDLSSAEAGHFLQGEKKRVCRKDLIIANDFPTCIWQPPKSGHKAIPKILSSLRT